MKVNILCTGFLIVILASCVRHKHIVQFQSNSESDVVKQSFSPYLLQSGDLLSLRVSSLDEESISVFNKEKGERSLSGSYNEIGLFVNSYLVDDSGYVHLPLIGKIVAKGNTVEELHNIVGKHLEKYYKFYSLDVKLVNFKITVIGEVILSGSYNVYREKINVIEAIALAKGFNSFANTEEVILIRVENGQSKMYYLNFLDKKLIEDSNYYCKPGDVLYVNPRRSKAMKNNTSSVQLAITSLSFVLLLWYNLTH